MTDDNPSMGIKTKACVNGVYPDTIPTINQNISNIQDDISDIQNDIEDVESQLVNCVIKEETGDGVQAEISDGNYIVSNSLGINLAKNDCALGITEQEIGDVAYATPCLPVDGSNNPVEPPRDAIITSSNLDVDPRLVRTSGNQTINGTKTFTENLKTTGTNGTVTISDSGLITYSNQQGSAIAGLYNTIDNQSYMFAPDYYPVDSDENPEVPAPDVVMTSGMIVVDPRIVHTIGNETVAGTKQGDFRGRALTPVIYNTNSKWVKYCSISHGAKATLIEVLGVPNSANGKYYALGYIGGISAKYARNIPLINSTVSSGSYGAWISVKVVLIGNKTNNTTEVWVYCDNATHINGCEFYLRHDSATVVYYNEEYDTLPSDGTDYSSPVYILGSA